MAGPPPLKGWLDGVGRVQIPDFPTADNSVESEFYSPPIPGEEGLLRTSPHVGEDRAQHPDLPGRSHSVSLPGAQWAHGVDQPDLAELQRRRSPIPVLPADELARIESTCKRHNSAARNLRTMLLSSVRAIDTRINRIQNSSSSALIKPVVLDGLK